MISSHSVTVTSHGRPLRLAYLKGPPGSGPPVLFLHGMGSSRWAFWEIMEAQPVPGTLWALDLPGFGASSWPRRRQTLDDFTDAVKAFVDAVDLVRPILVGHSFGAMVAGEAAIRYPETFAGVILVAGAGPIPPQGALRPTRSVCINRLAIWLTSFDWYGNRMLRALGLDPSTVSAATRRRMRYGWRRAREMARMTTFYESPRFVERLAASAVPVAVIHGTRDVLFPLAEVSRAIGDRFPVFVLAGAGHLPYDYDLAGFNRLFRQAYLRCGNHS